jgi:glycosyltransferase involved in cell wall biosynthesis
MNISFIIVTNGAKPKELELQLKSIRAQKIPTYEIVVVGDWKEGDGYSYIPAKELTDKKLLGALRNRACDQAKHENLVISDDDMLFTLNWYKTLLNNPDFEILTGRVNLPDGGRYWDHVCYQSPTNGHSILEGDQTDSHLYMSGGQSWIMKKSVFQRVRWGEQFDMAGGSQSMSSLQDYAEGKHNEDTDFAEQCRKENIPISHNHNLTVWHNDDSYTTIGKFCRRRQNNRKANWMLNWDLNFPPHALAHLGSALFSSGLQAEAFDLVRHALTLNFQNPELKAWLKQTETLNGGSLTDVEFHSGGAPSYNELVNFLDNDCG